MTGRAFFDTTILIYSVTEGDPRTPIAERLLASGGFLSIQVLNEFAAVAHRKLKMSWAEIAEALKAIRTLCEVPVPLTLDLHIEAIRLAERFGYNVYDCLILAAAVHARCETLYSEDMQHGQTIGTVTILNPFAPTPYG